MITKHAKDLVDSVIGRAYVEGLDSFPVLMAHFESVKSWDECYKGGGHKKLKQIRQWVDVIKDHLCSIEVEIDIFEGELNYYKRKDVRVRHSWVETGKDTHVCVTCGLQRSKESVICKYFVNGRWIVKWPPCIETKKKKHGRKKS